MEFERELPVAEYSREFFYPILHFWNPFVKDMRGGVGIFIGIAVLW
ncbi:hypothetical protein HMPREF9445_01534 [Bacteroides clarus YIT 12056]|uniref:Uncharacterized protein n=1 Tax=Bacteroides clarus YIT 12056 TaxID=762984 RepID=A0ABP2KRE7_9BACE|nr:hypothetical protein HMPREF9445_01534 [Bacteroides clarus YIT 12056]